MDGGLLALAGYYAARLLLLIHGYMTTHNTFLHPLIPEEEAACLAAMRSGDRSARAKLIEHNLRLVAHIVKKLEKVADEAEDLISVGTIGLINAIETFDPNKGARLATYASRCIENEILMFLRAGKKTRHEVSLHEPIGADREGNELTLMDVLPDDSEPVAEAVARQQQAGLVRQMRARRAGKGGWWRGATASMAGAASPRGRWPATWACRAPTCRGSRRRRCGSSGRS